MPTQPLIDGPSDQHILPVCGNRGVSRIVDSIWRIGSHQIGKNYGQQCRFRQAASFLLWRIGEQIHDSLFGFRHGARQRAGIMKSVGIRKQQPFCRGALSATNQSVTFSCDAGDRVRSADYTYAREGFCNGARSIFRAVVNDRDRELDSLLGNQRFQAAADAVFLVTRRHYDLNRHFAASGFRQNRVIIRL